MNSPYQSHLPVLEFMMRWFDIKSVLEYGVGDFSTPFFRKHVKDLVSVESDSTWGTKLDNPDYPIEFMECSEYDVARAFDLVFVDGNHGYTRKICVAKTIEAGCRFVLAHDTDPQYDGEYKYSAIKLPKGWLRLDYKRGIPWTSIYTEDQDAAELICKRLL